MSDVPTAIMAQSFVVTDASGKPRVFIGMNTDSTQPIIEMFDEDGKRRVIIGLTDQSEPSVALLDREEDTRVALTLSADDISKVVVKSNQSAIKGPQMGAQFASGASGPVLSFDFGDGRKLGVMKDDQGRVLWGEMKEDGLIINASQI